MSDIGNVRKQFDSHEPLSLDTVSEDPIKQFELWFDDARKAHIPEPNGFVLATANEAGRLRSRTVLLKFFDGRGFVFYTNFGSQKAKDIIDNPHVSACFPWYGLERQVMIDGIVEKVSNAESLKYFTSRPRGSQIGAWVSEQSQVISSRAVIMDKVKQLTDHFKDKEIPVPEFWGGYRIVPHRLEFWQGQPSRLHDRIEYVPCDNGWKKHRLSP
ncbi:MAG: pyridoxamine 5'-phosphate oxidase [Gammaproteobacteria bacterium]|nr:pyridoxamine 5'-phosphate oxidase [Gammaproteobacteria bacterium]